MHKSLGYKVMMLALFAFPVLGLGGTAAYVAFSGGDVREEHYAAGREFQKQNKLDEAIAEFNEAIRLNPTSLKALTARGDVFYAQGRFREAMEDYDHSIGLASNVDRLSGTPDHASQNLALAEAYMGRAFILTVRGDDMEAQRSLAEVEQIGVSATEAQEGVKRIKSKR